MENKQLLTTSKPLEMSVFFDIDAEGYDDITREWDTEGFYKRAANVIHPTEDAVSILDLGIGTGYELPTFFARAPNAHVTGIDLSSKMLEKLRHQYAQHLQQLTLVQTSFLDFSFPPNTYRYVFAIAAMHHYLEDTRFTMYRKIKSTLQSDGIYIEGDKVIPLDKERQYVERYFKLHESVNPKNDTLYHIDVPCSVDTQKRLLLKAGFKSVDVFQHDPEGYNAVVVAKV